MLFTKTPILLEFILIPIGIKDKLTDPTSSEVLFKMVWISEMFLF